jgi:hypothetical protein
MLGLEGAAASQSWDTAGEPVLATGHKLGTAAILIAKIEDEVIEQELKKLGEGGDVVPQAGAPPATEPPKELITFDDFKKVDSVSQRCFR